MDKKKEVTTVLVIGIRGAVGQAVKELLSSKDVAVWGTSSVREITDGKGLFHLNFQDSASIGNFQVSAVDHVVITSGYEPRYNLHQTTSEHLKTMFDIHVTGPMLFLKTIHKKISVGGSITLLSSPAAYKGSYDPAYAAVKGAINALVKTLAKDFAPAIRVNAVSPSLIEGSPVYVRMTDDFRARHLNNTLTQQHTSALDCAEAIEYLINARQVTGQVLHVNGGMIFGN